MTRESEEEGEEEPAESFVDQLQQNALIWESVFQLVMDASLGIQSWSLQ